MARPFTASDDDILRAAAIVMHRRGPDAFALAEVATEVGLSRAAIILRFKSTHDLKLTLLTKLVESFENELQTLPNTPSGDNLLQVAAFVGDRLRSRKGGSKFFANYFTTNVRDRDLLKLEIRRGAALNQAVSKVMPPVAIDHASAVRTFISHLTGCIVAWLGEGDRDSRGYLIVRTKEWLKLVNIPFSEQLAEKLAIPSRESADAKRAGARSDSPRTGRIGRRVTRA